MNEDEDDLRGREDDLTIPLGNVSKVKQNWQMHEDFGLAYKMQNNEFSHHYDKNRCERRLMHSDICLTKEEQKAEDSYAAAYHEQLRRDQLKEDERLASELQRRLDEEECLAKEARLAKEQEDRMLAERLQNLEMDGKSSLETKNAISARRSSDSAARSACLGIGLAGSNISQPFAITKSLSGDRLVLPPGMTPELLKALEESNEPIVLPPGVTLEQYHALQKAALEEDRRLAEEVQDYELARFVKNKETPMQTNCVKPSALLALTKGRKQLSSTGTSGEDSACVDRGGQYSVISKKSKKNLAHESANEKRSDKGRVGEQ